MKTKRLTEVIITTLIGFSWLNSCSSSLSISPSIPAEKVPDSTIARNPNSREYAKLEESVHQEINRYRQSRNLPPLTLNAAISKEARLHSEAMARGKVPFSHKGFPERITAIAQKIPYRSAAENVAYNQGYSNPEQQAVEGWIKSENHRQNMEGNFDLTGIGVSKNDRGEYYFTQVFIKRS
ncbi:MAG TPA: CAP domain-containing protein [Cyanobacteria bacterium UBA11149]|nr:CAP domain-containing protein [Cyanobacteria bacterium UBA11367]HBE60055.1 CAP domain-containing protein [Cyanobacteria bacterium UBA11366]HBK62969.1 CAP domain-containing protein [Cyanobacteria bacterium UBA11166]HBR75122.1 CAP domain-containing protein [Cyanobacteria bacterium UBA11159]HBS68391.1 CAP domain-containing protein [Cyanobacteria bacterium UBA11153]HBW87892.1 CAP domain-containing protein [Cyanobacteria bacterium UBA11149]HCA96517.1 CAP domain-containing protein [Cyanobacteria